MADEERSRDIIALAVGHEEGVQLANQLILDMLETARNVVFGDNHAVENLDGILTELVVVAETQVDDMPDKRVKSSMVILQTPSA